MPAETLYDAFAIGKVIPNLVATHETATVQ